MYVILLWLSRDLLLIFHPLNYNTTISFFAVRTLGTEREHNSMVAAVTHWWPRNDASMPYSPVISNERYTPIKRRKMTWKKKEEKERREKKYLCHRQTKHIDHNSNVYCILVDLKRIREHRCATALVACCAGWKPRRQFSSPRWQTKWPMCI